MNQKFDNSTVWFVALDFQLKIQLLVKRLTNNRFKQPCRVEEWTAIYILTTLASNRYSMATGKQTKYKNQNTTSKSHSEGNR